MDTDIIVIGGNPGGLSAAISAARSGYKVVVLEPSRTLGGINANGVFGFDSATPEAISGIASEVEARIQRHYAEIGLNDPLFTRRADQVWESHVLAKVWHDLVGETEGVTALTGAIPVDVRRDGDRITEIHWQRACDVYGNIAPDETEINIVRPRLVIDASYEGDVFAWAGVPHRLGREARSWEEPHAGVLYTTNMESSADGWLPQTILPGSTGEASEAIMAYALRLHCRYYDDTSPDAAHRIKSPPPGYDPTVYAWHPLARDAEGNPIWFNTLYVLVNEKFLVNRMVRGNNLAGPTRDYILAHPRDRKNLRQRFIDHALGYLYYIQTEGGMPELGLAHDEFADNDNIPYQIYIREGRRIEGEVILTEADMSPFIKGDGFRAPRNQDAVAMGDWMMESHGCTDVMEPGYPNPEGFFYNRASRAPYQVPYAALLPKGVDNLIVCGGISATHIAVSAVRCEAARIQMGIAAGVAAGLALKSGISPRNVPVRSIQADVISRGGKVTYFKDVAADHPHFQGIQWAALRGVVPKDDEWRFFPDHPVSWSDFVTAIVLVLELPISVTGQHFENIGIRDPIFRYLESLYDLGSRAGIDFFGAQGLADEDPMKAMVRLRTGPRLIPFSRNAALQVGEARRFLAKVAVAVNSRLSHAECEAESTKLLTRGELCSLLVAIAADVLVPGDMKLRESGCLESSPVSDEVNHL